MNESLELSQRQLLGAWELMCAPAPTYIRDSRPGLEFVFSHLPIPFFNIAVVSGERLSSDDLAARGRDACQWSSTRNVPWFLVVTEEGLEAPAEAAEALAGVGLVPLLPLTGMLAQRVAPLTAEPPGLELSRPEDDAGCAALLEVNARAYGMDLSAAHATIGRQAFWREHVAVLGRADGVPVSCSAVMRVDGHRYVALVATDPSMQRRGFADASMRSALELAARTHGEHPTFLHATAAGRPVYERMGYQALASHTLFIEQRFLGGD